MNVQNATVARQQTEIRQKELEDQIRPSAEQYLKELIDEAINAGASSFKVDVSNWWCWARSRDKKSRIPLVQFELRHRAFKSALKELIEAGYQVRELDTSYDPTVEIKW